MVRYSPVFVKHFLHINNVFFIIYFMASLSHHCPPKNSLNHLKVVVRRRQQSNSVRVIFLLSTGLYPCTKFYRKNTRISFRALVYNSIYHCCRGWCTNKNMYQNAEFCVTWMCHISKIYLYLLYTIEDIWSTEWIKCSIEQNGGYFKQFLWMLYC